MVRHHAAGHDAGSGFAAPVRAAAFAVTAGAPVEVTSLVHVDTVPQRGRRLLLTVEPIEPSERGLELAALALKTLRETFAAAGDLPPAAALMKAFTAANAVLINENRPLAGCRWERRVYVGATGIVIAGREMIIAQIPPTAAMIVQDKHLYAFPELASWRHDYLPVSDDPEPDPMGCREGTRPYLFRTVAAPGDLITFCSTGIARQLGRADNLDLAPLLSGDPERALDFLGELVAERDLDDAHAAAIHLRRLSTERGLPRLSLPGGRQASRTWPAVPQVARPSIAQTVATGTSGLPPKPVYAVRTDWGSVGIPLDRPLPADDGGNPEPEPANGAGPGGGPSRRLSLALGQIARAVSSLSHRLTSRPRPAINPPLGPPLRPHLSPAKLGFRGRRYAMAAPGAGSVRRYREQPSFPLEWRSNLPRGPELHIPSRLLGVGLVLFLAFGGSGALFDRYRTQVAQADAALATVDGSLQAIVADPATAASSVAAAEAALEAARLAGADAATLRQQALAVEAARDQAWGNIRLQDVTRLGVVPADLAGQPVHLARTGHDVWLIGNGLYGVDSRTNTLVQVLSPGTAVQGGVVQALRAGVADGGRLLVADEAALYVRDDTGRWRRHFMNPTTSGAHLANLPMATYLGSLYALADGGRLLKFGADNLTAEPETWVAAEDYPELLSAKDLAIDGRIHVLLRDGRILTFFRGALAATLQPDVTPSLVSPSRLVGGPDTNFLYVLDGQATIGLTTGRIVRVDGAGNTSQILPPLPVTSDAGSIQAAHILSEARDLVIDEEAGLIYFTTDTELWRAALPR